MSGITYAFALCGMQIFPPRDLNTDTEFNAAAVAHFGSLMDTMLIWLQLLTLDSAAAFYRILIVDGEMPLTASVYVITYIMVVSIATMNLVTAVMVEGAMQQAAEDKELLQKV